LSKQAAARPLPPARLRRKAGSQPSDSMELQIRRMREADLDSILAIETASFTSPWSRSAFENEMRAIYAHPLVVTQAVPPHILGYLCFWMVTDECHILNLAVHPSFRRAGIASSLIRRLLEVCEHKHIRGCFLEVRISNKLAISLYRKFGFVPCGIRKRYYPDTGEDAMVMKRRFPSP